MKVALEKGHYMEGGEVDSNVNASYALLYVTDTVGDEILRHPALVDDRFQVATSHP